MLARERSAELLDAPPRAEIAEVDGREADGFDNVGHHLLSTRIVTREEHDGATAADAGITLEHRRRRRVEGLDDPAPGTSPATISLDTRPPRSAMRNGA